MEPRSKKQFELEFWQRVDRKGRSEEECWEWIGYRNKPQKYILSYGRVYMGPKLLNAHRVAWIITHGEVPKGMLVCHKCDNPPCCNPNHLFLGTHADNVRDCVRKKRKNPVHGERQWCAILSESDVREIRRRYVFRGGKNSTLGLAKEFGVDRSTITAITTGRIWKHIV